MKRLFTLTWIAIAVGANPAQAVSIETQNDHLTIAIKREISKTYPGARIELLGSPEMGSDGVPAGPYQVQIQSESARGEVMFTVSGPQSVRPAVGRILFQAWVPARVAIRRVLPGQKLSDDQFKRQEVNVASGMARESRGIILENDADLSVLETRQTILEGQFIVSSAVSRIPDIRRGDTVRVQLTAGGLSLSTLGIAGEPAYVDGQVRVLAGKTKRELVGKLVSPGLVEVKL